MSFRARLFCVWLFSLGIAAMLVVWPVPDLAAAGYFYNGSDFPWRTAPIPAFFHDLVHPLALGLGGAFALWTALAFWRKRQVRVPLFLLLTLVVAPGLVANTLFKDHWGRARPIQIEAFGGDKLYTPPGVMADQCARNCSFIGGDAAFGFWFQSLAYVAPVQRRRRVFVAGLAVGFGYSLLRVAQGAHFLSDVFFSGLFMTLVIAALAAVVWGKARLRGDWQRLLGGS